MNTGHVADYLVVLHCTVVVFEQNKLKTVKRLIAIEE